MKSLFHICSPIQYCRCTQQAIIWKTFKPLKIEVIRWINYHMVNSWEFFFNLNFISKLLNYDNCLSFSSLYFSSQNLTIPDKVTIIMTTLRHLCNISQCGDLYKGTPNLLIASIYFIRYEECMSESITLKTLNFCRTHDAYILHKYWAVCRLSDP